MLIIFSLVPSELGILLIKAQVKTSGHYDRNMVMGRGSRSRGAGGRRNVLQQTTNEALISSSQATPDSSHKPQALHVISQRKFSPNPTKSYEGINSTTDPEKDSSRILHPRKPTSQTWPYTLNSQSPKPHLREPPMFTMDLQSRQLAEAVWQLLARRSTWRARA